MQTRTMTLILLLTCWGFVDHTAAAAETPETPWPCHLIAHAHLRPFIELGWTHSATFRQQCLRLAAAQATVVLQGASATEVSWDAQSRIGKSADGLILAQVLVRHGRESIEVIAHELEHVLERIDGEHPAFAASRSHSGATAAGGAYETTRAIRAGQQVAREVTRGR